MMVGTFENSLRTTQGWIVGAPTATGSYATMALGGIPYYMNTNRLYFASNVLPSGNIFLMGGEYVVPVDASMQSLAAYEKNRIAATEGTLDGSPLGTFLLTLAGQWLDFDRSPTDMLELFTRDVDKKVATSAGWPKNAQAFTSELRRISPHLLMRGVVVIFRRTHKDRRIRIVTKRYGACAEGAWDADTLEQRSV